MKRSNFIAMLVLVLTLAESQFHAFAGSEDVVVEDAWARASVGTSRPGAAYMTIRNSGEAPISLTGFKTPQAMMAEIHETKTNSEGVSSMAPMGKIVVPPGEDITLKPGGMHLMLMRLQKPLVKGETFPLTLVFSDGKEKIFEIPILELSARGPAN